MTQGDIARLPACTLLWFFQQDELLALDDMTLIYIAPTLNQSASDDLKALDCTVRQVSRGLHRIDGLPFSAAYLETDELADREALLAFFSSVFLADRRGIGRFADNCGKLLYFMYQQIQQFATREDFLMQFADTEAIDPVEEELKAAVLRYLTVEERLQGLAPEERLRGLDVNDFLRGLSGVPSCPPK